jgi:phosphoglycolate phosphatase-like HAD superfamily hydrolase
MVSTKEGLEELMELMRASGTRVALVTRNTTQAVEAFFRVAPQWRQVFEVVLTREFQYVKPDKRLVLHVAQVRAAGL